VCSVLRLDFSSLSVDMIVDEDGDGEERSVFSVMLVVSSFEPGLDVRGSDETEEVEVASSSPGLR
jgi:hypothetical protein